MAFVITVAQRKGGAGKSTLVCQLMAAFTGLAGKTPLRVAALDCDEQASLTNWCKAREKHSQIADFDYESTASYAVGSKLRQLQRGSDRLSPPDIILIDTPPAIDATTTRAIKSADLVLVPLQLSPLDLEATLPTARLIGDIGCKALFVINRAPPRARIADLIREKLKATELPLAKSELGNRAAYPESMANGFGVVEKAASSLAAQEIRALAQEVLAVAGLRRYSRSRARSQRAA